MQSAFLGVTEYDQTAEVSFEMLYTFYLADLLINIFNDKCCKIRCSNADNMVGLDGSTFKSQSGGNEAAEHLNGS